VIGDITIAAERGGWLGIFSGGTLKHVSRAIVTYSC
jgi:hypothetical protein